MAHIARPERRRILRTPAARFASIPDFPYDPHYLEINGVRVHYVDVGAGAGTTAENPPSPQDAPRETVLCVHGEPSWAYVYRKVIAALAAERPQWRVVAPDFIGFGKSDKFAAPSMYTHELHRATLIAVIEALDLRNITLVVQDWGGLTGLSVVKDVPERIARLVVMNTGLPPAGRVSWRSSLNFACWRAFVAAVDTALPIGAVMRSALRNASDAEICAYEAPFHEPDAKAGAVAWPALVPLSASSPVAADMAATRAFLREWTKPALVMFSDKCPVTRDLPGFFARLVPGARSRYVVLVGAGHFLQDDAGEAVADHIMDFATRDNACLPPDARPGDALVCNVGDDLAVVAWKDSIECCFWQPA
ncbi:haloalkane dehalogenase [Thecamonas trahens ATCC 50062]|uniref:Haloalkane dehalogenase n=1 Tax=Thecamonas trahens ATCC 50062 TaxID=461836 RepID=A0A0L0DK18_THETB|nr:haloalkane dehalogenase [Thecamonas trahens ATCC 50062]KNC51678.1 haloalkane dehalogenase [Thecamonas trahens ATCC 50062]|eukprot:XP_013755812.1 haloalkane dehalogenase [Thecamonas trahens ATCC 50062]